MKIQRDGKLLLLTGILATLGASVTVAQAAIVAVNPPNGAVLKICADANCTTDITDIWLPTWSPAAEQSIWIRFAPSGQTIQVPTSIAVLAPPQGAGSALPYPYPGKCTNFGAPTDTGPDVVVVAPNQLVIKDCGARALIRVNGSYDFVIPADSDNDGLPDIWEQQESTALSSTQCPNRLTCIDPNADSETIGANVNSGDGYANIDEYRGFIANNTHVRTKTTQKDLFAHLVNPQCSKVSGTALPTGGVTDSLVGRVAGDSRLIFPSASPSTTLDPGSLFGNFLSLGGASGAVAIHLLDFQPGSINVSSDEWVDNFDRLNGLTVVYKTGTDGLVSDRQVNLNALKVLTDVTGNLIKQKGVRIIECVDNVVNSPIGYAIFPPGISVGNPDQDTNSIVYTQRIWKDFEQVLNYASSKGAVSAYKTCALNDSCVYFQTYKFGFDSRGAPVTTYDPPTPLKVNRNFIVSKYIQYIIGMETGHSVALTPVLQIAQYGAHYAPGSGDNLDQRILAKDSTKVGTGGVIYYLPTMYGSKSNDCFQLKPTGAAPTGNCQ
jgi:hypothetical protein